jgi:hypothetical protein
MRKVGKYGVEDERYLYWACLRVMLNFEVGSSRDGCVGILVVSLN